MVTEPPQEQGFEPAAVQDRRAPDRRARGDDALGRRAADRTQFIRVATNAALAICGGLAVVFLFFWALGAIDARDAVAATIIAVVFALAWLGGFIYRQRHEQEVRPINRANRERRGY